MKRWKREKGAGFLLTPLSFFVESEVLIRYLDRTPVEHVSRTQSFRSRVAQTFSNEKVLRNSGFSPPPLCLARSALSCPFASPLVSHFNFSGRCEHTAQEISELRPDLTMEGKGDSSSRPVGDAAKPKRYPSSSFLLSFSIEEEKRRCRTDEHLHRPRTLETGREHQPTPRWLTRVEMDRHSRNDATWRAPLRSSSRVPRSATAETTARRKRRTTLSHELDSLRRRSNLIRRRAVSSCSGGDPRPTWRHRRTTTRARCRSIRSTALHLRGGRATPHRPPSTLSSRATRVVARVGQPPPRTSLPRRRLQLTSHPSPALAMSRVCRRSRRPRCSRSRTSRPLAQLPSHRSNSRRLRASRLCRRRRRNFREGRSNPSSRSRTALPLLLFLVHLDARPTR